MVWCYWKTANEEDRKYFEAKVTEVWADSVVVEDQSLQSRRCEADVDEELDDDLKERIGGKAYFTQQFH